MRQHLKSAIAVKTSRRGNTKERHITIIDLTTTNIEIIENMSFAPAPQQSAQLAAQISRPDPLTDAELLQPAAKRQRQLDAISYEQRITTERLIGQAVEINDIRSAKLYSHQVFLADSMPNIQRNLAPTAAADVALALAPQFAQIQAQFAQMQAQFAQATGRHANGFATRQTDTVISLPRIPIIIDNNPVLSDVPLPPIFPATRGALFDLNYQNLAVILLYYGQTIEGNVYQRRARLLAYLGVPPEV